MLLLFGERRMMLRVLGDDVFKWSEKGGEKAFWYLQYAIH